MGASLRVRKTILLIIGLGYKIWVQNLNPIHSFHFQTKQTKTILHPFVGIVAKTKKKKMEVSLSSTCIPLSFKSNSTFSKHNNNIFHSQIPTLNVSTKHRTTICNAIKPTLSSNWLVSHDLSAKTASPWLPNFEELDITNMLLRQRILFLGSQVMNLVSRSFGFVGLLLLFWYFKSTLSYFFDVLMGKFQTCSCGFSLIAEKWTK